MYVLLPATKLKIQNKYAIEYLWIFPTKNYFKNWVQFLGEAKTILKTLPVEMLRSLVLEISLN